MKKKLFEDYFLFLHFHQKINKSYFQGFPSWLEMFRYDWILTDCVSSYVLGLTNARITIITIITISPGLGDIDWSRGSEIDQFSANMSWQSSPVQLKSDQNSLGKWSHSIINLIL